jgi:crotonobetainyl-CoA:carnitine CoA-transferase CaiB-like acyl-CoA transferase
MSLPLQGVTVLDLSRILAGPYCTMILGDMGAEVVKVEPPGGDDSRAWGPPFVAGESTYFLSVNRNKKSICIDLKKPDGCHLLEELLARADILVENFRPGTLERLGFGYEQIRPRLPRLVYCSISGYGQTGPLRDRPGYDAIIQGEAGWMSLTGFPDGPPLKLGASLADIFTGMMACQGILLALYQRRDTGKGQQVDVALYDSVVSTLCYQAQSYLVTGEIPGRLGNRHPSLAPYETFETADGHLIVGVGNDALWRKFCAALGRADLDRPEFEKNADRVGNYESLKSLLAPLFRSAPTSHWLSLLERAGVPAGRVRNVAEVFDNPQVAARQMLVEVEHAAAGALRMAGNPIKMTEAVDGGARPAPLLGEHTEAILSEKLGLSAERIRALREQGVVR